MELEKEPEIILKIVLAGDSGTGKTNILSRFIDGRLPQKDEPTAKSNCETAVIEKCMNVLGKLVKLQFFDIPGQERYHQEALASYGDSLGAFLVYDVTSSSSFKSIPTWLQEIRDSADSTCEIYLVGNKCDIKDRRSVSTDDGIGYAKTEKLTFFETSAKEDINIKKVIMNLIRKIVKKISKPIPGFSLCNPQHLPVTTTYMSENGAKIEELFGRDENEKCVAWPTEVLEELIKQNKSGFFVTDLAQLQDLTSNLFRQITKGREDFIPFLQKIITLSMVPFRKVYSPSAHTLKPPKPDGTIEASSQCCFSDIGGFFKSLCPIITLPYPELQLEASRALLWFAKNCGPLHISQDSTFIKFYPHSDEIALYSVIPNELKAHAVVATFAETFSSLLSSIGDRPVSPDLLANCFRALFEFVKRHLSSSIPPQFVTNILNFILDYSDIKPATSKQIEGKPICSTRIMAQALLFFGSFIQENKEAMQICTQQTFISSIWSLFVEALFSSFKNTQKQIRNELLSQLSVILSVADTSKIEKNTFAKMISLLQNISILEPDVASQFLYSNKMRKLRLTHEVVDVEIIIMAQDLLLIINERVPQAIHILPSANFEFIQHQIKTLDVIQKETLNKYLMDLKPQLTIHSIQLLQSNICDIDTIKCFYESNGVEVLMNILSNPSEDESTLFFTIILALHLELCNLKRNGGAGLQLFKSTAHINSLMNIDHSNPHILSAILSLLAVLMQPTVEIPEDYVDPHEEPTPSQRTPATTSTSSINKVNDSALIHIKTEELFTVEKVVIPEEELIDAFLDHGGLDLLKECFVATIPEVVTAAVDCARSIAPLRFRNIGQRLVFMLLDCADSAPALIRYDFVGLFLELTEFQSFINSALLWRSLKTNSNIQRTIILWWKEEEERLDIKYDKGIIIDIDKPLEGHPLVARSIRKKIVNCPWLLDTNSISPPSEPFQLDFRARLYLLLEPFPQLNENDCKPTDRIKELMIRQYPVLKIGAVWTDLRDRLTNEGIKPLHDDKLQIATELEAMRNKSLDIQEKQCDIWQKCENDRVALEQRTYNQLADGLKTAQFVAENYKSIINSQPVSVSRPYQGRTVKGEDVLVRSSNLRTQQLEEVNKTDAGESTDMSERMEKEMEENYINDCLKDESISYLVQLMKNADQN